MSLIGHVPTLIGALAFIAIAFAMRRIPRFGPRGWIMPAWVLMACLLTLFTFMTMYTAEFYAVYQLFRDPEFAKWFVQASPRAIYAVMITLAVVAISAGIALDLTRTQFDTHCPRCFHHLLASQHECPECGHLRNRASGMGSSRLDALAVRRPLVAMFVQFAAMALPASALVAIAMAFVPTLRTQVYGDSVQLGTADGRPALGHFSVSIVVDRAEAPMLTESGWIFSRAIDVRYSAEWEGDPRRPRPEPDASGFGHHEDVVIEARITNVAEYSDLLTKLDAAVVSIVDRSPPQRYIEMLLHQFLAIPESEIPQTPSPTLATESPSGGRWNGMASGARRWPSYYNPLEKSADRDSPIQTLVIPSAIGLVASAVLFWPQRRKAAKTAQE